MAPIRGKSSPPTRATQRGDATSPKSGKPSNKAQCTPGSSNSAVRGPTDAPGSDSGRKKGSSGDRRIGSAEQAEKAHKDQEEAGMPGCVVYSNSHGVDGVESGRNHVSRGFGNDVTASPAAQPSTAEHTREGEKERPTSKAAVTKVPEGQRSTIPMAQAHRSGKQKAGAGPSGPPAVSSQARRASPAVGSSKGAGEIHDEEPRTAVAAPVKRVAVEPQNTNPEVVGTPAKRSRRMGSCSLLKLADVTPHTPVKRGRAPHAQDNDAAEEDDEEDLPARRKLAFGDSGDDDDENNEKTIDRRDEDAIPTCDRQEPSQTKGPKPRSQQAQVTVEELTLEEEEPTVRAVRSPPVQSARRAQANTRQAAPAPRTERAQPRHQPSNLAPPGHPLSAE